MVKKRIINILTLKVIVISQICLFLFLGSKVYENSQWESGKREIRKKEHDNGNLTGNKKTPGTGREENRYIINWMYDKKEEKERKHLKTGIRRVSSPSPVNSTGTYDKRKKGGSLSSDSGIVPYIKYGLAFPVSEYRKRYENSCGFSAGARFEGLSVMGFIPDLVFRYNRLKSRKREGKIDSSLSLFQVSAGLIYSTDIRPGSFFSQSLFLKRPVKLYLRGSEGITRLSFTSDMADDPTIEYINTLEISAGFILPLFRHIESAIDFGYRYIATKDVPLQTLSLMLVLGLRM